MFSALGSIFPLNLKERENKISLLWYGNEKIHKTQIVLLEIHAKQQSECETFLQNRSSWASLGRIQNETISGMVCEKGIRCLDDSSKIEYNQTYTA